MTSWMVVGAGGMLGQDLVAALRRDRELVVDLTRRDLDITDRSAVAATVRRHNPEVLVNCAAWTAVDEAETHEDEALRVNGTGTANLAAVCAAQGTCLVHISTDYVFDGDARRPYSERDAPYPRTAYGRTKLTGEQAVLELLPENGYVVRTAWLYGAGGPNFVRTMMRLERQRPTVDVVGDQHGQPTWTVDLAGRIAALVRARAPAGIYHATSSGETTWFELAREVFLLLGADPSRVRATTSGAYQRTTPRPAYSVLGHEAWAGLGIDPIGNWKRALRTAFPALAAVEGVSVPSGSRVTTGRAGESR